jgi:hypothetical protein
MNHATREERGVMMIEALIAMTLVVTAASGTLWFLHRALQNAAIQRAQLEPPCEKPTCSSEAHISECRCGTQTFIIIR